MSYAGVCRRAELVVVASAGSVSARLGHACSGAGLLLVSGAGDDKEGFLGGAMLCFVLVTWFAILTPEERTLVQSYR